MTFISAAPHARRAPLSEWINARLADLREAARRREVYRRTLAELETMSDRELDDLGISHFSIRDLARQAAEMA